MPTLDIVAGYWHDDNKFDRTATNGVRAYQGNGEWVDITFNIADFNVDGDRGWYLWDLQFVGSKLYALLKDGGSWGYGAMLLRFDGTTWTTVIGSGALNPANEVQPMSCLFCWNGQTYVAGDGRFAAPHEPRTDFMFHLYRLVNETLVEVDADSRGDLGIYIARRTCIQPVSKTDLVLGDLDHDSWGLYHSATHSFSESSDYGGSCVFAVGVDHDGTVWSGDYGRFFYYSRNSGRSFVKPDEFEISRNSELPEVWEFYHWDRQFVGVGCNPCNIVVRNGNPIDDSNPTASVLNGWDVVCRLADFFPNLELRRDGRGFMSCEADGPTSLLLGFGGEPWYYFEHDAPGHVFRWNGSTLTDVGGGLDWGNGVHILTSTRRQCTGGVLAGTGTVDRGVRLDSSTDTRRRGLAQPPNALTGRLSSS